ncbi:unnamed protein product, partial [Prunus brigantina]
LAQLSFSLVSVYRGSLCLSWLSLSSTTLCLSLCSLSHSAAVSLSSFVMSLSPPIQSLALCLESRTPPFRYVF